MKYFEISNGYRIPVFGEEQVLLDRALENPICETDLDLREAQVASQMATKGILIRTEHDGEVYYDADRMDIWRI